MIKQVRAELIKLATVRATYWCAVLSLCPSVVVAAIIALRRQDPGSLPFLAQYLFLFPAMAGVIPVVVLAVLVTAGEYGYGMIRVTFMVNPRRGVVMASKAVVVLAYGFVLGLVTAYTCAAVALVIAYDKLKGSPAGDPSLADPHLAGMAVGLGLFYAFAALMSAAWGTVFRHSAPAIALLIGWWLAIEKILVPMVEQLRDIYYYLPFAAGARAAIPGMGEMGVAPPSYAASTGSLILAAYAVAAYVAAVLFVRLRGV
ncbi:hypothetical protein ACFQ08_04455 [Streptosporangium algeriense]|uniref:ABC transporter permease n=1 Tax=Streptosporangium algeriense TaxID=1682748 RepID=A0ABW3DMF7_9ACTN